MKTGQVVCAAPEMPAWGRGRPMGFRIVWCLAGAGGLSGDSSPGCPLLSGTRVFQVNRASITCLETESLVPGWKLDHVLGEIKKVKGISYVVSALGLQPLLS